MSRRVLFVVLTGFLLAANADASEYDDFRIPDHHWRRYGLAVEGRWTASDFGGETVESTNGNGLGQFSGVAEWGRDSDRRQHWLAVSLTTYGIRSHGESSEFQDLSGLGAFSWHRFENQESVDRALAEVVTLDAQFREYPWERPWGIVLGASARAQWNQTWHNNTRLTSDLIDGLSRRYHDVSDQEFWFYQYSALGELRFGYGRVRDATGVYQAQLLVERLRGDGRLARDPSASAIQRLAQVFHAEHRFGVAHDYPQRFFWREVERILREDGALGEGGFDAFEAVHALAPLAVAGGRFYRSAGWFAGPLVQFEHNSVIQRADGRTHWRAWQSDTLVGENTSRFGSRGTLSRDIVMAGAVVQWSRPLGVRTQLDAFTLARFDVEGVRVLSWWETSGYAAHLIDERWYAWARAAHARQIGHQEVYGDHWQASAGLGVRYYLEDRWNIGLEFSHFQREQADLDDPHGAFRRQQAVTLSVGWDTGALDAPGLFGPVRPLN